jgi:hypothetical protein
LEDGSGSQAALFFYKPVSKKCGNYTFFIFRGRFRVSINWLEEGLDSILADFSSNKRAPVNRKKGIHTSHPQKNE